MLLIILLFIGVFSISIANEHDSICDLEMSSSTFCPEPSHTVLELDENDDELAAIVAKKFHTHVLGKPFLKKFYFLEHVRSVENERYKRDTITEIDHVVDIHLHRPRRRSKRDLLPDEPTIRSKRNILPNLPWPDPLYRYQWYLHNGAVGHYDMNVQEAWLLGYSGKNISVTILDDGIQRDHIDLILNYDPLASSDVNDHDDDPMPRDNGDNKCFLEYIYEMHLCTLRHGTRCAGEVASIAGNNQCGVGVAYSSKIGGVRMLDGPVSDSVEAAALSLNQDHIDIYSASWGPEDDGKTFDGPGPMAKRAFFTGIKEGRGGKGNIFVWASGNGGSRSDSCSADGYTTSVYTLSISSATFDNHRPWYLEECPSTIACTYSSANFNNPAIITVDVPSGCTQKHTGTSASAPLAAGIIALALEANPSLTWRDTQHVVLRTANPKPLLDNPGWSTNGVGRKISSKFGYGLMDAGELVKLARKWRPIPEQHSCIYEYRLSDPNPRPLTGRFQMNFTLHVGGCRMGTPVLYLEHVQVLATARFSKRGDLQLTLFSPVGTRSMILPQRPNDYNTNGFHMWPFLTVQMWGEDPRGDWTLMVESVGKSRHLVGTFHDWSLLLYGTELPAQSWDPVHNNVEDRPFTQDRKVGRHLWTLPVLLLIILAHFVLLSIGLFVYYVYFWHCQTKNVC